MDTKERKKVQKENLMALTNDTVSRQKISLLKCSFFFFILMEFNSRKRKTKKIIEN